MKAGAHEASLEIASNWWQLIYHPPDWIVFILFVTVAGVAFRHITHSGKVCLRQRMWLIWVYAYVECALMRVLHHNEGTALLIDHPIVFAIVGSCFMMWLHIYEEKSKKETT